MPRTRCASAPRPARACRSCSRRSFAAFRRRAAIPAAPVQALIVDSWFDNYVGVVSLVRVVNGTLRRGEKIRVMSTGRSSLHRQARPLYAQVDRARDAERRRGRVRRRRHPRDRRRAGRRHHHARCASVRCAIAGFQTDPAARVRRACSRSMPRTTRASATRSPSSSSTTRRCTTSRKYPPHSGSASAADSSDCCTWTSSRSGSSASTRSN